MKKETKKLIIFVCTFNQTRSTMAEFIMKKLFKDAGMNDRYRTISRGALPDLPRVIMNPGTQAELKANRIPFRRKYSCSLSESESARAEYIFVMEKQHLDIIRERFPASDLSKIHLLGGFPTQSYDIPNMDFDLMFAEIARDCQAILKFLEQRDASDQK